MLLSSPCSSFEPVFRERKHPKFCHILQRKQALLAIFRMYILNLYPIDVETNEDLYSLLSQRNTCHPRI